MMALAVVIVGLALAGVLWLGWLSFLATVDQHADRYLKLLERAHTPAQGTSTDEPIPDDIVAHILSTRHAKWAQEQELAFAREKYREYGQWPPVRVLLNIGTGSDEE